MVTVFGPLRLCGFRTSMLSVRAQVYARESKLCTRYVRTLFGHSIYLAVVLAKVGRREKTAGIEVTSRYLVKGRKWRSQGGAGSSLNVIDRRDWEERIRGSGNGKERAVAQRISHKRVYGFS
ncbi:uncharacterized protein B0T23DRAFT_382862 [Neurospora hispaniola]|uniref:Uncharacterized protein n=1 Tax=Neurospora hispaniola TaxID=588809 RepID=A0AAJ0I647_9PEZI|nr:hypothetical protein B0T23DRAFT_382862 [Neurospora hispaniola]